MGSSRKEHRHKKDHHKRKHRRHSDSEEESPREKRSKYDRHDRESRSHKSSSEKRHRSRSNRDHESREQSSLSKSKPDRTVPEDVKVPVQYEEPASPPSKGGGGDESLSIAETNKLREKLGLKPLSVGGGPGGEDGGSVGEEEEFVHAPAEDLWKKKKQDELREKIQAKKEKRLQHKKLGKIKTLGEEEEGESASSWVIRSRNKEVEKKREAELSAIGDEFGVGDLVEDEMTTTEKKSYTEKDLKGMNVEHSIDSFKEGKNAILVIKDKDILASDDEDVLHSINIDDAEKSKKNLEIKRRGAGYKAYEEEEVDDLGFFKSKTVLGKYDEEIGEEKSNKFTIGSKGMVDTSWEQQKESMKQENRAKGETLTLPPLKLASEYLTEEEMKFKKRKRKVKKVRKRVGVKADDLLPLPFDAGGQDHGKRSYKSYSRSNPNVIPGWNEGVEMSNAQSTVEDEDTVILDEDDAGDELERALQKSRRAKKMLGGDAVNGGAAKVVEHIENLSKINIERPEEQFSNTIFLNATDEFCRQLGSNVAANSQLNNSSSNIQEDDDMEIDPDDDDEDNMASQWNSVNPGGAEKQGGKTKSQENDDHAPIEAEPLAGAGVMGALQLAKRKGYLTELAKKGNTIVTTNQNSKLHAQNYAIEDKNAVDYLDKYASEKYTKERTSRYDRGMIQDFNEKKDYKPSIAIEYVDDRGRGLSAKEAFRNLSHRFHGKGSGKSKQEKRMKKRMEADTMKHMSSTDTPLNTVAMMKEKLRQESSPYIVLSGAGKTLMTGGGESLSKHK